jgi:ankyrin repeat protein
MLWRRGVPPLWYLPRILSNLQCDLNAVEDHGRTPMHVCAHYGHAETIRCRRLTQFLAVMSTQANPAVLRTLHELGAKIESEDEHGQKPMHEAARKGECDAIM